LPHALGAGFIRVATFEAPGALRAAAIDFAPDSERERHDRR
jgi:hypothetical protein